MWSFSSYLMVGGHDAFQYFSLQYYFLNNAVQTGEIPQWLPYMTHGTVASWWYAIQAGFLQNVYLLFPDLLKNFNFYYLFNASMVVDEMLLMVGCWLLSGFYLKNSISKVFFTLTVLASSIWLTQTWWNFHFYYCLPLMLYFISAYFKTFKKRFLFFSLNLFIIQSLGNLPYFIPIMSFILALYFLIHLMRNLNSFIQSVVNDKALFNYILIFLSGVFLFYLVYVVMSFGTGEIVRYNFGRLANGTSSLDGFLTYAGNVSFGKWKELVLGISPELDFTLYGGLLIFPLAFCGCVFFNKRILPIIIMGIVLIDFSVGGITARGVYYLWPTMKYYRHLSLVAPLVKIFIFLVAAYGFDYFLEKSKSCTKLNFLQKNLSIIIFLIFIIYLFNVTPSIFQQELRTMIPSERPDLMIFIRMIKPFVGSRLFIQLIFSLIFFLLFLFWIKSKPSLRINILFLILTIHLLDIYSYKVHETRLRSTSVQDQISNLNFYHLPYLRNRNIDEDWKKSSRSGLIQQLKLVQGVKYWTNDLFLFRDSIGVPYKVDHWLWPLDRLMRTYWGQQFNNTNTRPSGLYFNTALIFPMTHPAIKKISGIEEDKIQFFTKTIDLDDATISSMIQLLQYGGDIPFISKDISIVKLHPNLKESSRLRVKYEINDFSSNHVTIKLLMPQSGWLYYSDVWHPSWQAVVNGKNVTVERGNLAYKMVEVPKGISFVQFNFYNMWVSIFQKFIGWWSLCWIIGIIWLIYRILFIIPNNPTRNDF